MAATSWYSWASWSSRSASKFSRSSVLTPMTLGARRRDPPCVREIRPARSAVALFLDLGRLPDPVPHVVQLRPPDVAAAHDLDLGDDRRVHRERSLYADLEADLTDGEGLLQPRPLPGDDVALEDLDAL